MGIINQNFDTTEQRSVFYSNLGPTATGVTAIICAAPAYSSIDAIQVMAFGTSGSPNVNFMINRFIVGTGFTSFTVGSTQAVQAYGTSGVGVSGTIVGYTLGGGVTMLANDVLMLITGGSNAAVTGYSINVVLRPLGDRSTYFGII